MHRKKKAKILFNPNLSNFKSNVKNVLTTAKSECANFLVQGECDNPESEKRNAHLVFNRCDNGEIVGRLYCSIIFGLYTFELLISNFLTNFKGFYV